MIVMTEESSDYYIYLQPATPPSVSAQKCSLDSWKFYSEKYFFVESSNFSPTLAQNGDYPPLLVMTEPLVAVWFHLNIL